MALLTEQEKETLLAQAKRDYPKGTTFNSTGGTDGLIMLDSNKLFWNRDGSTDELRTDHATGTHGRIFTTHNGPRWADITRVATPIEPIVINDYNLY